MENAGAVPVNRIHKETDLFCIEPADHKGGIPGVDRLRMDIGVFRNIVYRCTVHDDKRDIGFDSVHLQRKEGRSMLRDQADPCAVMMQRIQAEKDGGSDLGKTVRDQIF